MQDDDNSQGTEEVQQEETQGQPEESGGTGLNPAWNEFLDVLPSSLHSVATPHLQKWDQNFQSKIQEVHSQYEPYKKFLDEKVDPDRLSYAHQVLQQIEDDPQSVLEAIQAYMGVDSEQGLEDNEDGPNDTPEDSETPEVFNHPEFVKMRDMVNQMAQIMVQQRESNLDKESEDQYNQDLKAAEEEFGMPLDEDFILSKLIQNEDWDVRTAAESYVQWVEGQKKTLMESIRQPGPPVLDNGGSVPQANLDPRKLDTKDRRGLVASMLRKAHEQSG